MKANRNYDKPYAHKSSTHVMAGKLRLDTGERNGAKEGENCDML